MLDIFRPRRMWRRQGELKPAYDVVIVGGGSHGLAAVYYLQKEHGIRSVAVLEKRYIGSGAAGRGTTSPTSEYNNSGRGHVLRREREAVRKPEQGAQLQPAVLPMRPPDPGPLGPRDVRDGQPG